MLQKPVFIAVSELTLQAVLHLPDATLFPSPPVVMGSHGLLSTKDSAKQLILAEACTDFGVAYLRLDHRGCGESQGEFLTTTVGTRVEDLMAAAATLKEMGLSQNGMGLFGSSMGGATCLAGWEPLQGAGFPLKGMVSLAAPVTGEGITEAAIAAQDELHGVPLSFYRENMDFNLTKGLSAIHHILVVHGDADEIVPVANARLIMEKAKAPKELIINGGGDHRQSDPHHQARFFQRAAQWFKEMFER